MLNLLYSQNRLSVAETKRSVKGALVLGCADHLTARPVGVLFPMVSGRVKSVVARTICEFR